MGTPWVRHGWQVGGGGECKQRKVGWVNSNCSKEAASGAAVCPRGLSQQPC